MRTGKVVIPLFGLRWLPYSYSISVPERMEELNAKQLEWWAENVVLRIPELFTKEEKQLKVADKVEWEALRLEMCRMLTGIPLWLWRTIDLNCIRDLMYTWDICSFMYSDKYEPSDNPVLEIAGYYGPVRADYFTPWEFSFADAYYLRYKSDQRSEDLDLFIAQLYRPKAKQASKYTEEVREAYDNEGDVHRLDVIAKASKGKKLMALYWYEQWRTNLKKDYRYLFGGDNDAKTASSGSWLPVFMSAGNGIENFDKIKDMQLLILFAELNRIIKQRKDEQRN